MHLKNALCHLLCAWGDPNLVLSWKLLTIVKGTREQYYFGSFLRGLSFWWVKQCGPTEVWRNQSIKRSFIWLLMNWKVRSKYAGSRICTCSWLHSCRGKEAPSRFARCFPPPHYDVSYFDGCRKNDLQPKLFHKITQREVKSFFLSFPTDDELRPLSKLAECCWSKLNSGHFSNNAIPILMLG